MLVYSRAESPRLAYIMALTGRECFEEPLALTTDPAVFIAHQGPKLQYGGARLPETRFYVPAVSLLFETGVRPQVPGFFLTGNLPVFFAGEGNLPFDLFAGIFFLVSRYEEWLPFKADEYGRFPPEASFAFQNGFLNRPLIEEWLRFFQSRILEVFPRLKFRSRSFHFLPTYDIDMAWSYRGKGFFRNGAGLIRDMLKGDFAAVKERAAVISGAATDPFDCFAWLDKLHEEGNLQPRYFVLLADKPGRLDKNIPPSDISMQALVKKLAGLYDTGIHPSWQSGDDANLLAGEIARLAGLSGRPVVSSRQHYLRLTMPVTYRRLLEAGIRRDFSMGYGSSNGFRASFTGDFYWYDLETEEETGLLLTPFCFMDFAAFDDSKESADDMLEELQRLAKAISQAGGRMVTLWHNHFLGPQRLRDWRAAYESFVRGMS